MSALLTEDLLANEAKQSTRADFEQFLKKVPNTEPEAYDSL
jgi:hypothetical protein